MELLERVVHQLSPVSLRDSNSDPRPQICGCSIRLRCGGKSPDHSTTMASAALLKVAILGIVSWLLYKACDEDVTSR